jgi:hypothetical protein
MRRDETGIFVVSNSDLYQHVYVLSLHYRREICMPLKPVACRTTDLGYFKAICSCVNRVQLSKARDALRSVPNNRN